MLSHYGIKYNQFGVIVKGYTSVSKEDDDDDGRSIKEIFGFSSHKQTEIIGWPEDKNKRGQVSIATLEYEIIDWKLKVKIGGLGVMSSLMGKPMTDVNLIWVVPGAPVRIRASGSEPGQVRAGGESESLGLG